MTGDSKLPLLVPVQTISQKLDNDDPAYAFGAPDLYLTLALAYDSLAAPQSQLDRNGISQPSFANMQPRLALRWEEQPDGDWIVRLRPGVRSQAGNEFTAADVAWVFDKAYAHRTLSSWRWREVVGVERVDVLDRYSLRYHLRAPYPTFPNWLLSVTPNVVDSEEIRKHATSSDPWAIAWLNTHVAGFGPYDLDHMDADHLLFSRRSDYWMGTPEAKRVEVRRWPDRASAIELLDDSRPVIVVGTDPDETFPYLSRDDVTMRRTWAGHVSIEIDFKKPPFDDRRVRHALAYATPYDRLIRDGLLGMARPWHSPVKSLSQWYNGAHWRYREDLDQARKLLAEAGYGNGFQSDFYVARRTDCKRMAEIIADTWRKVGIELVVRDVTGEPAGWLPPLLLRTECSHNLSEPIYDIAHDYVAMDPILPLPGGPPTVATWRPRWTKNDDAIAAYAEILLERDAEKKRQRFDDLQRWLVDFSSSIFIAEVQQTMIANRHVPVSFLSSDSRFFQTLQYQNTTSNYLPLRPADLFQAR